MKISRDLYKYFYKAGHCVSYKPSSFIYMQEDTSRYLYLIIKGRVRVYSVCSNGEEITYDILDEGHFFGDSSFFSNSPCLVSVCAINDVELILFTIDSLIPYLKESHELTVALLSHMSHTCDRLSLLLKRAYTYNRYEKVASFLLEQTLFDNPNKGIYDNTLPYTHEEISTVIGLSRVTTTKVLNEFKRAGYISIEYKKIKILDRKALSNIFR